VEVAAVGEAGELVREGLLAEAVALLRVGVGERGERREAADELRLPGEHAGGGVDDRLEAVDDPGGRCGRHGACSVLDRRASGLNASGRVIRAGPRRPAAPRDGRRYRRAIPALSAA
jgi:hypothetical protein